MTGAVYIDAAITDPTFRMIGVYYGVGIWALVASVWWLFFSGVTRGLRLGLPAAVAAIGVATWFGLVRRLDFNGAMAPKIEWRWNTEADVARTAWREAQADLELSDHALSQPLMVTSEDWPRYCGADGSRVVREPLVNQDWDTHPPRLIWRHPVGQGWSSFAVVGPRLFTQEQRGESECIVCYHAETGHELWAHQSPARYETAMGGIGPRATPTIIDQALFALGATGLLTCLDPVTGMEKWQIDVTTLNGVDTPPWGFACSPLAYDGRVIVIVGGEQGTVAFDQESGELKWGSQPHKPGYSSARIEIFNGERLLLAFYGDGLAALDPDNGFELWHYPFANMYHVNAAQPLRANDYLFIGSGYDGGCVALDPLRIQDGRPAEVWPVNNNLKLKFNEAVERDGFVYGLDDGILCCVEAATGRRQWKAGRYRHGQVLLWGNLLLVQAEKGHIALVSASPDRYEEVTFFPGLSAEPDGVSVKAWNVPAVRGSRLYLRTDREAACYSLIAASGQ
jgi:outer membrane protein assembly factor BamB